VSRAPGGHAIDGPAKKFSRIAITKHLLWGSSYTSHKLYWPDHNTFSICGFFFTIKFATLEGFYKYIVKIWNKNRRKFAQT
jgi:hypothetical protein